MRRSRIPIFVSWCVATPAIADSLQIALGLSVTMQYADEYARRLKTEQEAAPYGAFRQRAIATPMVFKTQMELLTFFDELPPSGREKGLWIMRFARPLWNVDDAARTAALTETAQQRNLFLYLCEAKQFESKSSWLVAWECTRASLAGNWQPITCEAQPEKDKASGPQAWNCTE